MGLFNKKDKAMPEGEGAGEAAVPAPAPITAPTVELTDKKEPLLPKSKNQEADAPIAVPNPPSGDPEKGEADKFKDEFNFDEAMDKAKVAVLTCFGLPYAVKLFLAAAAVSGVVIFGLLRALPKKASKTKNVAMIGNSYFFVNDLPRLMETISDGLIYQDSCLHGSGSLLNILKTGNGMYYKWNTDAAMLEDPYINQDGEEVYLYDYGACSVPQLLLGQDEMLTYQNQKGAFLNDGNNPCLEDEDYLEYEASFSYEQSWDYVVMADQSKRMSFDESRQDAIMALNYTYGPILKSIGATPILVQTHAFWSQNANMTGLTDVPTFTSMIMEGAEVYTDFLKKNGVKGKIAPVGDAFLTVWEEDYDLWETLFLNDFIHPSPKGSYLYACVVFATIYGAMPDSDIAVGGDVAALFENARKVQAQGDDDYPTEDEASYLYNVARRVAIRNFTPKSYKTVGQVVQDDDDDDDAAYYDGDDAQGDDGAQGDDAAQGDDGAQNDDGGNDGYYAYYANDDGNNN